MLYISTRNKAESFTAFRVLREAGASDGGKFVPFQLQPLDSDVLQRLYLSNFHGAVAAILNLFFSVKLTAWDVELCAGRNIAACRPMGHKLIVAELWRNPSSDYRYLENALYAKMAERNGTVPHWVKTVIRTAVLFGVYTQMYAEGIRTFDIAVNSADGATFLAAYFARYLGLPIGNIIIGCDESSGLWDLFHKGCFPASASSADTLEVLVYSVLGSAEASRLRQMQEKGRNYILDEDQCAALCTGFFASVVGTRRSEGIISSFWKSNRYIITSDTAISFSALQDYRSKTGESRDTLLLSDRSPMGDVKKIQNATGLSYDQIAKGISVTKE